MKKRLFSYAVSRCDYLVDGRLMGSIDDNKVTINIVFENDDPGNSYTINVKYTFALTE